MDNFRFNTIAPDNTRTPETTSPVAATSPVFGRSDLYPPPRLLPFAPGIPDVVVDCFLPGTSRVVFSASVVVVVVVGASVDVVVV